MLTFLVGFETQGKKFVVQESTKELVLEKANRILDTDSEKKLKRKLKLAEWKTCIIEPIKKCSMLNPFECAHTRIRDEYGKIVCEDCGLVICQTNN